METKQHSSASWPRSNSAVEWSGYLSLAPLLAGLATVGLAQDYAARELAQRITLAWGGALLAFGGAVHWGLALAGRLDFGAARIAGALAPALTAAAAIVIGGQRGLALLVIGFGVLWLYEHRGLGARLPPAYLALRRQLAIATCLLLAVTMIVSDSAGLS